MAQTSMSVVLAILISIYRPARSNGERNTLAFRRKKYNTSDSTVFPTSTGTSPHSQDYHCRQLTNLKKLYFAVEEVFFLPRSISATRTSGNSKDDRMVEKRQRTQQYSVSLIHCKEQTSLDKSGIREVLSSEVL